MKSAKLEDSMNHVTEYHGHCSLFGHIRKNEKGEKKEEKEKMGVGDHLFPLIRFKYDLNRQHATQYEHWTI